MTVVNPKSISGINSITMASGSDDLLTIHSNNTTERVRVNNSGDVIIGSGVTLSPDGDIFATGVCTATSFSGDGSSLTGIAATDNVRTGILDVAGVGTFRGDVNIPDKIIHLGDTDTAIRFPSADTITAETGGSERLRIDSNGKVVIGHNASVAGDGSSEFSFQLLGTTYVTSGLNQQRYANDVSGPSIILGKSRATSVGTHTIVQNGDQLGKIRFYGSDGNDFANYGAEISANVDGSPGNNDMPGRLEFKTTSDGGVSPTERLRIDSSGDVTVSTGNLVIGTAGKGIDFSATSDGSGTDTSELLDDYEEGTWTPTLSYSSSGSATLSEALGYYVKIGRKVHVTITVTASAQGSGSGNVNIGGLPYQTGATQGFRLNGHLTYIAGFTNINSVITLYRAGAGSYMEVFMMNSIGSTDAITTVTRSNITNNCTIRGMATYYID